MLYPLSYEGASAQSSDPGVHLGWQGVAQVHPRSPYRRCRSPGAHPEQTNPGLRPAVGCGDPRWHRLTRVGIRWRAHTAHIIETAGLHPAGLSWAPRVQAPGEVVRGGASIGARSSLPLMLFRDKIESSLTEHIQQTPSVGVHAGT